MELNLCNRQVTTLHVDIACELVMIHYSLLGLSEEFIHYDVCAAITCVYFNF